MYYEVDLFIPNNYVDASFFFYFCLGRVVVFEPIVVVADAVSVFLWISGLPFYAQSLFYPLSIYSSILVLSVYRNPFLFVLVAIKHLMVLSR